MTNRKFDRLWERRLPVYRKDPVKFAVEILGVNPDRIQRKILWDVYRYDLTAVKSGHGIGKTFCASITTLWWISCYPNSRAVTTAPTGRQVREVLWAEIHKLSRRTILTSFMRFLTTKIEITKHWGAIGISSDRPENIEGFHADYLLFIIDEAKGVIQDIFNAVMGTQTTKPKVLIISTPSPNPLGEFFNAFKKGSVYHTIEVSCFDSPRPGMKKYIKMMKKKYGENSPIYQMKVLGKFPDISEDTLIPWKHVNAAVKRKITLDPEIKFIRILACDPARFGMDKTVIVIFDWQKEKDRWLKKMVHGESHIKKSTTWTAGRIKELDDKWHCDQLRVDCGGGDIGAGVVDQLNNNDLISHKVVPFVAGGKEGMSETDKNDYSNWKAKAYDSLRMDFEYGTIDIWDFEDLCEQLILLRKDYTTTQRLKILDYDEEIKGTDIKHKSPDYADAVNIACAPLMMEEVHVIDDPEGLIL